MAGQAVISGPALQAVIRTLETLAGVRLEPVARAALLHTLSSLTTYQYEVLTPQPGTGGRTMSHLQEVSRLAGVTVPAVTGEAGVGAADTGVTLARYEGS